MDRRRFLLTSLAGALATPFAAEAERAKDIRTIGYLSLGSAAHDFFAAEMSDRLHRLGWQQRIKIESKFAAGNPQRVADLARELAGQSVDVIVAVGGTAGAAAKSATGTIPIVITYISDPVRVGLAESYARPGANLTAVANFAFDLTPKQLELLKEAYPRASRVAVLGLREGPGHMWTWDKMLAASAKLGVSLYRATVGGPTEFPAAFTAIRQQRADALIVEPDPVNYLERARICDFATDAALPSIGPSKLFITAGCLMAYTADDADMVRRTAIYVDRILRGERAGDLPIDQSIKFSLFISLKTAKALGLTIPPSLLLRADQVIE